MKVFGGMRGGSARPMLNADLHDLAFRYAVDLPEVALAVVGMKDRRELHENLARARGYRPLPPRSTVRSSRRAGAERRVGRSLRTGLSEGDGPCAPCFFRESSWGLRRSEPRALRR